MIDFDSLSLLHGIYSYSTANPATVLLIKEFILCAGSVESLSLVPRE